MLTSMTNFGIQTHSVDPDQTAPVCYRDILNGLHLQGSHRLEKYLNIQDCLEKSLKIKFAVEKYLENTQRP